MVDLLYMFPIIPPQIRERKFRHNEICLEDYSEEELCRRYRFGRDSLEFLAEVPQNDLLLRHEKKPKAITDSTNARSVAFFRQL